MLHVSQGCKPPQRQYVPMALGHGFAAENDFAPGASPVAVIIDSYRLSSMCGSFTRGPCHQTDAHVGLSTPE